MEDWDFNLGTSIDYSFLRTSDSLGKAFAVNTIVPQGIPFPELKTGFITFGVKLIVVLKKTSLLIKFIAFSHK